MEYTDDESYEMVGSDCSHFATSDSEEESYATVKCYKKRTESFDMGDENNFDMGFATDSEQESYTDGKCHNGTESSDSGKECEFRECGIFRSGTIGLQRSFARYHELPAYLEREDLEIKDVVRNHVLPFLPAKSLVRFKTVSKDWDQWIGGPFLAHKNSYLFRSVSGFFYQPYNGVPSFRTLDHSVYGIPSPSLQFLPESVVIRSSCHGLLLCQGCGGENLYYICNPANEEWKVLPLPDCLHGSEPAVVLAFEPSELNISADFKVVRAFHLPDMLPVVCFDIYSSEEGTWRHSTAECSELGFSKLEKGGFYMKGFAYWETSCGKVLAFDMVNECYGILPLPSDTAPQGVLTEMHGELCYIHAHNWTGNAYMVDIHGGIDMSLRRSVVIDLELGKGARRAPQNCQALPCVNGDVVMILIGKSLYSYHLRDRKADMISLTGNDSRATYFPYVNSLVSWAP